MSIKAIVHVSGGLDSAASYLWALNRFGPKQVLPVFYDYGQSYLAKEFSAAEGLCARQDHFTLRSFKISLFMDEAARVPEYVPYRNLILCAHSLNLAASQHAPFVVTGSKSRKPRPDDVYSFKDSTYEPFTRGMNDFVRAITEREARAPAIIMPLMGWRKSEVLRSLIHHGHDPAFFWTCYGSGPEPCGKCKHCQDFEEARKEMLS